MEEARRRLFGGEEEGEAGGMGMKTPWVIVWVWKSYEGGYSGMDRLSAGDLNVVGFWAWKDSEVTAGSGMTTRQEVL
jgi:hypothetical protein